MKIYFAFLSITRLGDRYTILVFPEFTTKSTNVSVNVGEFWYSRNFRAKRENVGELQFNYTSKYVSATSLVPPLYYYQNSTTLARSSLTP